ncbi:hypothetical protein E2C01_067458 [Portunus trituberculatus]|uniref:Uncharacterized protein n=1 Tax=Portunus trituberculatus TaxID=210409 RepID=A0A5B7HL21_PORTR|nr:hypothetical protein [Portunus trituberculatus]
MSITTVHTIAMGCWLRGARRIRRGGGGTQRPWGINTNCVEWVLPRHPPAPRLLYPVFPNVTLSCTRSQIKLDMNFSESCLAHSGFSGSLILLDYTSVRKLPGSVQEAVRNNSVPVLPTQYWYQERQKD